MMMRHKLRYVGLFTIKDRSGWVGVGDNLSWLPPLPSGVEYIDGETLDRAFFGYKSKNEKGST